MSTVGNDTTTDWEMMSNDSELNSGDSSDTRTRSHAVTRSVSRSPATCRGRQRVSSHDASVEDQPAAGPTGSRTGQQSPHKPSPGGLSSLTVWL